jgi:Flp pilus assembly protein TadG
MKKVLRCEKGSATVEFVALALPLFVPIIFFLHQFASVSGQEEVARTLAREGEQEEKLAYQIKSLNEWR